MARALKVYRTPIGFHDAYVAASSQKAALEAWGSDHDLFARGIAELVTDAALSEAPLARPGEVIKRLRGTAAQQIDALPANEPKAKRATQSPPAAKRGKRPSRSALERAEQALADAQSRFRKEHEILRNEERALVVRRRAVERNESSETAGLEDRRAAAEAAYRTALGRWEA